MTELLNEWVTELFVEQPLALPRSAKHRGRKRSTWRRILWSKIYAWYGKESREDANKHKTNIRRGRIKQCKKSSNYFICLASVFKPTWWTFNIENTIFLLNFNKNKTLLLRVWIKETYFSWLHYGPKGAWKIIDFLKKLARKKRLPNFRTIHSPK